jgi:hypothetical protein
MRRFVKKVALLNVKLHGRISANPVNTPEQQKTKRRRPLLSGMTLVAVLAGISAYIYWISRQEPKELGYWLNKAAAGRDWSNDAASGKAEAQLCVGLNLIQTNLIVMSDRIPGLASIPLIGRRFFQKTHYQLASNIEPQRLMAAYTWVKKSANQGFAPATNAEQLFAGRIPQLGSAAATNGQQVAVTNR